MADIKPLREAVAHPSQELEVAFHTHSMFPEAANHTPPAAAPRLSVP